MTSSSSSSDETTPDSSPIPTRPLSASSKANPTPRPRVIHLNSSTQPEAFLGNAINTGKYSVWSFIPSFLFEQFHRYSNIFFLGMVLLQQIPDVSPTGKFTTMVPLVFILSVSALKEIIEDVKRHKADVEVNNRAVQVLKNNSWEWVKWRNVAVGDFVKIPNDTFFPADLVIFSSSEQMGICYIETANLDGETNLKIRQGIPETMKMIEIEDLKEVTGELHCELPNRFLYEFAGKLKLDEESPYLALGPEQLLLRGAKLQNTSWILALVIYTGQETKLMKNSTKVPLKRSTVDKLTNKQIVMLFWLLIVVSLASAGMSMAVHDDNMWYLPKVQDLGHPAVVNKFVTFLYTFMTFIILYNNLIPISLTVTLEVVRFIQAQFINWDCDMYHPETNTFATARTSNLNEELGQVRYIFSDKTGTLTRNVMEFRGCSCSGDVYYPEDLFCGQNELVCNMDKGGNLAKDIHHFLILLSVCHSIIPEYPEEGGETIYHASSPDEIALVSGARCLGYAFEKRTPTWVEIKAMGITDRYELLNTLEFTSQRKRMSVIVRAPNGKIKLYCKGADTMIFERLKKGQEKIKKKTDKHLEEFSTQGLRTLCCAMREIPESDYKEWQLIYQKASTELHERETRVEEAAELIEMDLHLLGATAIEDKLQEKVPETIAALLKAGISVWVLTGDKQETAINIGYSCHLLNPTMNLLTINKDSFEATWECILNCLTEVSMTRTLMAVVIDGATLKHALHPDMSKDFLRLCCSCKAVIVCRASPMQKAEIVDLVTQETGEVTLAIGDGANDVAMIQKAHVGIGISGQEGLQAALASDYAIAQFRFLTKLLFVHGAWNYDRMSKLIFYSYYKNICLYIIELWFAIYSGWSGQIIFERWTIGFYNMFFTCAQPIAIGVCERHYSAETRLKYPILYKLNQDSFNLHSFFLWIGNSLLHSICLFWFTFILYGSGILWASGKEGGYLVLGNFIYTYVVVVVSLKSGLETRTWTVFTHFAIWGSILLWFLFLTVYSYAYTFLPIGQEILGIAGLVFTSPVFWVGLLVVPSATLFPDFIWKAMEEPEFQTLNEKMRMYDEMENQRFFKKGELPLR
ncbi:unnamed protein product [Orchesella dallaii]